MPEPHETGDRTPAQRQADHASLARLSETLVPALVAKLTRDRPRRGRGPRGRLADPRPPAGRRAAPRRAPRRSSGRGWAPAAHGEPPRARSPAAHARPLRRRRARPPTSVVTTSPAVGIFRPGVDRRAARRPRRRPDRGRRPARHPAGRRGARSTARRRRASPRRARPSSTARSRCVEVRSSPRRPGPTARARRGGLTVVSRVLIANRGEIALRDPARLPRARHRGRRRLLRGRPRVARPDARRRGDLHRAGRREALVPLRAGDDLGRARHRLRRDPPGLRLPVRGRRVRRCRRAPTT